MPESQINNYKGAFGYNTTDIEAGRAMQRVDVFRNMSTVNAIQRAGQAFTISTLVGEGNEALPGTTVADGTQRAIGIAIETATTNTNTTNQSTNHPTGAWFRGVTYGPVWAFVTSAVEKGDLLMIGASTVAPVSGGRLAPLSTAATTRANIIGYALTSGTSGTTARNGYVFVNPQIVAAAPTS